MDSSSTTKMHKRRTTKASRIFLGADHRGFSAKQRLARVLSAKGYDVRDLGAHRRKPTDDYPQYALAVARAVADDAGALGILVCGSGIGMAIAANKIRGIRAGLATTPPMAAAGRGDDAMNILVLAADFTTHKTMEHIVSAFLTANPKKEARYARRVHTLARYGTKL